MGERLDQALLAADLGDFVKVDQRFNRELLGVVVREPPAGRQAMIGEEPVVEQAAGRVGGSGIAGVSPLGHLFLDGRHARGGRHANVKERGGGRISFLSRHDLT